VVSAYCLDHARFVRRSLLLGPYVVTNATRKGARRCRSFPRSHKSNRKTRSRCGSDHEVHERLKQHATFIQSPKDYVIGQALRRLFRKDKDFAAGVESQSNGNGHGLRT
jgi:hypothetical protein